MRINAGLIMVRISGFGQTGKLESEGVISCDRATGTISGGGER